MRHVRIVRSSPAGRLWSVWWGSVDTEWRGWPLNPLLWGTVSFRISSEAPAEEPDG